MPGDDLGMDQAHRDRNCDIGSHDGYMRGSRLARREIAGRLSLFPQSLLDPHQAEPAVLHLCVPKT